MPGQSFPCLASRAWALSFLAAARRSVSFVVARTPICGQDDAYMNDALLRALSTVNDPELHRDLVSLGMIERAELSGDVAQVKVNLTTPACPLKGQIELDVRSALLQVPDALLADRGAVDGDVARAMAVGVRRAMLAEIGVATTGVA